MDVALKSVLGKIVNDHFREIRDHAETIDFLTYLYGLATIAGHQERVAWLEVDDGIEAADAETGGDPGAVVGAGAGPRLYLAVNGNGNSATWRVVRRPGDVADLVFSAYKRRPGRYTVSEVIAAGDDARLARLARGKYGVDFEFFFAMAAADADAAVPGRAIPAQGGETTEAAAPNAD